MKIEQYTKGLTLETFENDSKTVDAVVRNLEIIGEAAGKLPEDFRAQHEEIPWNEMIGMRNIVLHEYFGVDTEILWETVTKDISALKNKIGRL